MVLFRRQLRHHARLLVTLCFGLALLELAIVWSAAYIEQGPGLRGVVMQLLPPEIQGPLTAQLEMLTFSGVTAFGFQHPAALLASIAFVMVAASIPAGERENGFLDLVLARPVSRTWYLMSALALLTLGALLLPLAQLSGLCIGLAVVDEPDVVEWTRFVPAAASLALLLLAIGSYTLLIASGARRRGTAVGLAVGLTAAFYTLDFLAPLLKPLRPFRWLSPFHYFKPMQATVVPETPLENPIVLGTVFVVCSVLAWWRFNRQDL